MLLLKYQTDVGRLKSELARAQKENADHIQRTDKLKKQQDASDARIKELKQTNFADQATIKDLRGKLRSAENERAQLQSKQDDIGGAKRALQDLETKRREEARRHEQRITELEKSLASEKRNREAADKKVRELQTKLDEDTAQSREDVRRLESQAKDVQTAKQEAIQSLQAFRDEASEKQEEMLSQIDSLRSTLQRMAAEYGRIASSTVPKATHDVLKNEHAALQIRSWRLERKLANAEGQVIEVANLVRQTKDDNDMLRSLLAASDEAAAFYSSTCKWMQTNPQDTTKSSPEEGLQAQICDAQMDAIHYQLEVRDTLLCIAEGCSQLSSGLSADILSSYRSLVLQLDQEHVIIKKLTRDLDTIKSSRDVLSADLKSLRAEHEANLGRLGELTASLAASEASVLALTDEARTAESRLSEAHVGHEKALKKDRETIQRLSTTIHQHKIAEEALRAEIDQLTSELTDAERYQEAYYNLAEEVESLIARNQLAEDEAARLSKFNVEILSHNNPAQRIMYLDRVRRELAEVRQDLLSMTRDRDAVLTHSETLQHELDTYKSVSAGAEKPRTTVTRVTRIPLGMQSTNVTLAPARSIGSSVSKRSHMPTYDIQDEMTLDELTGTWDEP
ncbi:hypothetical protein EWM64_g1830 [Hericium alpestre]|uniref:Uncharacterized protein n=1 Tax=Hericium alpestre TaxID=135208 RepID=A0A4Z0A8B9_9AGAM|nr:hypothetical protein EWM64_g1830 [Hericium alpestre]